MQSDKKPVEKRRIGPAMQWAKPRADSDRAQDRKRNRINIDLDLETDWETAQPESTDNIRHHSSEMIDTRPRTYQHHAGSRNNSDSSGLNSKYGVGQASQPRFNDGASSGTAWDYYSGNSSEGQGAHFNSGDFPQCQDYPHFNDVVSEYPHQVEPPNYNARSTDFRRAPGNKTDQPGRRQLLLPILVVGLIIVVGLLSSLG